MIVASWRELYLSGLTVLAIFLIPFNIFRLLIPRIIPEKGFQRTLIVLLGLMLTGMIIFISMKVSKLPVPNWTDYESGSAGTLRTSPGELALFLMEIANPKFMKAETAEFSRIPQIELTENLFRGIGAGIFHSGQG